nr:hypothetical protein [Tanacetum cinerariifolium]
TPPLLVDQSIPDMTDHQKEVEVEDPKIVATRERKTRVVAKKIGDKKRDGDVGGGPVPRLRGERFLFPGETGKQPLSMFRIWNISERLRLGSFADQTGKDLNADKTEVFLSSSACHSAPIALLLKKFLLSQKLFNEVHMLKKESPPV